MQWEEFTQKVKITKLPYYLSDSPDQTDNHKSLSSHICNANLSKKSPPQQPNSESFEISPVSDLPEPREYIKNAQDRLQDLLRLRAPHNSLGNLVEDFFQKGELDVSLARKKLRCTSLERISLDDLQLFYRYNYSTKRIKIMVCCLLYFYH